MQPDIFQPESREAWLDLIRNRQVPEKYLKKNAEGYDKEDWQEIFLHQELSEEFIEEYGIRTLVEY